MNQTKLIIVSIEHDKILSEAIKLNHFCQKQKKHVVLRNIKQNILLT
jgi:hypothetical protein